MLTSYPIQSGVHQIIHPPMLGFLQKEFPRFAKHLFIYHHSFHDNFVIAGWTRQPGGRAVDLLNLGPTLSLTREQVEQLRSVIDPREDQVLTGRKLARMQEASEHTADTHHQDDIDELLDAKRSIWKHKVHDGGGPYWNDVRHRTPLKQKA